VTTPTILIISDASTPVARFDRLAAETRVVISNDPDRLTAEAPAADVIFNADNSGSRLLQQVFPHARKVRWVHLLSTGVERQLFPELVASDVVVTNGRGAFRRALGEWAVASMLYFAHNLRRLDRQQREGRWEKFHSDELHGRTLGIIGYGDIGRAAAERAKPFGMNIVALRRHPGRSAGDPLVDCVYGPEALQEMLAACDYVLIAAPLTPETRGLVGPAEVAAMKSSAVLVNVGRGAVVDEEALVAALRTGRLRGAALDVFVTEPLPPGHAFYQLDNVLLSPHCADWKPGMLDRAIQCFFDNLELFRRGQPLLSVVDKQAGY